MTITKKQIEHIAHLARLKLSKKEKERFSKELTQILNFVKKLKEVETSKVEPFVSSKMISNFRKDLAVEKNNDLVKKLLENVPDKEGNFIKTKKIFD